MFKFFTFLSFALSVSFTHAVVNDPVSKVKFALVYKGPGSCPEECSEAAAEMAELAGLSPKFIGPEEQNPQIFENAVVWIQPGGKSSKVAKTMNENLKNLIRQFVYNGGGYVGFCAGAFYATHIIGDTENIGLGIIAGRTQLYEEVNDSPEILTLNWLGKKQDVYWEGGPYFILPEEEQESSAIEVLATYPNATPASVKSTYGRGNVVLTGAHPEAPAWWSTVEKIIDPDGVDHNLAVAMIKMAVGN